MRVVLALHGGETSGGPSTRVPRLCEELKKAGVDAELVALGHDGVGPGLAKCDVIHVFNCWPSRSALCALMTAKARGARVVFSPILLDLAGFELWSSEVPALFKSHPPAPQLEAQLEALAKRMASAPPMLARQRKPGLVDMHRRAVATMLSLADHVIALGPREHALLHTAGTAPAISTILNAVDADDLYAPDPGRFARSRGLGPYVVSVGRIERRKNQLLLAHTLRDSGIQLVLVGDRAEEDYARLVERENPDVLVTGRLQRTDPDFASVVAGARAFALPSWTEGAPLAALEAGATGIPLVLSTRAAEAAYFGDHPIYVEPHDVRGMRSAIALAMTRGRSAEQQAVIRERCSWAGHVERTLAVYESVLRRPHVSVAPWSYLAARVAGTAARPKSLRSRTVYGLALHSWPFFALLARARGRG